MHTIPSPLESLLRAGKYLEALPSLLQIAEERPSHGEVHFWIAISFHLTGQDPQKALRHFDLSLRCGFDGKRVRLNRGILYAETDQHQKAAEDFREAGDIAAGYVAQTMRILDNKAHAADHYYPPPHLPHLDANWLETCSIPQSQQFMIDCLPVIRELIGRIPHSGSLRFLDVGTASAGGAGLLAGLYSGQFFGPRLEVDAIDLIRRYRGYAREAFPLVNYICGNLFEYEPRESWNLVFCSHTIEHLLDPTPLIRHCQSRARDYAIFYAPFEERSLIPGHLRNINREYVESLHAQSWQVLESPAWRHPEDGESRTVLFVLKGTAAEPG